MDLFDTSELMEGTENMEKRTIYVLDDIVWLRVAQAVQEAMVTGVDVVDVLRQIEVEVNDKGELTLTPEYMARVRENHARMQSELPDLIAMREKGGDLS